MPTEILANNIKYLRNKFKVTQREMAKYFGMPRTTIGHWETKFIVPQEWHLHCLSNYFGITIDDLCRLDFKGVDKGYIN